MLDQIAERRWVLPLAGILLLWAALVMLTERLSIYSLTGVATSASFLLFPALGQMLVITTGRGNIDLSIPSTVTLSAYISVVMSGGTDAGLPAATGAVLGTALAIGLVNAGLVVLMRIPAMIATLATGYILASLTLVVNAMVTRMGTPPLLAWLATAKIGGFPLIFLIVLALTILIGLMLGFSAHGRKLLALGQSVQAARLTGIRTGRIVCSTFVTSALLSALTGMLLSGYAAGAFLEMGTPYLLQSVGAVVLGGTLIAGGSATAMGTLFGAVLLVMIVTTLQIAGLPPGIQDILQGVVIIAVLAVAGPGGRMR
ncbi:MULTISPECIES: ABC transporter permease [Sinorhizobium]|uniref:ABC transporter permease n=1 Tax=Sinorhizobium TaxID=28105 RepID=UPI000C9A6E73|nr:MULTISPECIES: ABC transporter permease [Sinorhizobium]PND27410.1 ribose ABC transporter permease [Sinorhizobium sp. M4_45]RVQ05048.1 ABC transporter permease [Sinorhizobium meliloti]